MNPNSILKDAREAKGMTLEIVHEATKIPMDALKALEQGYTVKILTPFYLRGFIKIYAEFLGLDAAEVLKVYQLERAPLKPAIEVATNKKPAKEPNQSVGSPKHKPTKISQPGTVKGVGFDALGKFLSPKNLQLMIIIIVVVLAIFLGVKGVMMLASGIKSKMAANHQGVVGKSSKDLLKGPKEVKSTNAKIYKAQSTSQKAELVLRANKDTFIQVKVDGKVVFAMVMQKGTMESWSAKDEIILSGRDLYDLDMEINGNHIGSLGTIERKAHRVVITKEGLTVKK